MLGPSQQLTPMSRPKIWCSKEQQLPMPRTTFMKLKLHVKLKLRFCLMLNVQRLLQRRRYDASEEDHVDTSSDAELGDDTCRDQQIHQSSEHRNPFVRITVIRPISGGRNRIQVINIHVSASLQHYHKCIFRHISKLAFLSDFL